MVAGLIELVNAFAPEPWIEDDSNEGRLDLFFWLCAGPLNLRRFHVSDFLSFGLPL